MCLYTSTCIGVLALQHLIAVMSTASKSIKEKQLPAHSVTIKIYSGISRGFPATARLLQCVHSPYLDHSWRIRFYVCFKILKKRDFLRFWSVMSKKRKKQNWLRAVKSNTVVFRIYVIILLRFYVFYVFFFKIQKVVTFYVFCRDSYVFSNYDRDCIVLCYNSVIFVFIVFYVDPASALPYTIKISVCSLKLPYLVV